MPNTPGALDRTVPIIAVFGGSFTKKSKERLREIEISRILRAAECFGHTIGSARCILLTGGFQADDETVKGKAISGRNEVKNAENLAPRIGVIKDEFGQATKVADEIVLGLPYGDKRNYVEAEICDAAISLPGGKGTASEVLFCLALRRPVIFVGTWTGYELSDRKKTLRKLRKLSESHVGPGCDTTYIDRLIKIAYNNLEEAAPRSFEFHRFPASKTESSKLVELAMERAEAMSLPGDFPPLPDWDKYSTTVTVYNQWLVDLECLWSDSASAVADRTAADDDDCRDRKSNPPALDTGEPSALSPDAEH